MLDPKIEFAGPNGLRMFKPLAIRHVLNHKTPDMDQVAFVCYADDSHNHKGGRFRRQQDELVRQVKCAGVQQVFRLRHDFLEQCPEYKRDPAYFDQHCDRNGHAFKPVILKRVVESLADGTHLFYCDCRKLNLTPALVPLLKMNSAYGNVIAQYGDANLRWTSRAAFRGMDCDNPTYHMAPHIQNTWFLFKIDEKFRALMNDWAAFNCDPAVSAYKIPGEPTGKEELPGYIDNRGDQSILTNLCWKYGYDSFFGAGFGANKSPALFCLSMLTGSAPCAAFWRMRRKTFLGENS